MAPRSGRCSGRARTASPAHPRIRQRWQLRSAGCSRIPSAPSVSVAPPARTCSRSSRPSGRPRGSPRCSRSGSASGRTSPRPAPRTGRDVRTAAVVVSWEGGAITDRCVASLRAQDHAPAEVVVVDNASSATERSRLPATHGAQPGVRLLLLDENRQFAGGLNAGATAAFAAGADRVLLLNNDTVVAPDALRLLEAALEAAPGTGIVGPRVLDLREPTHEL